MYKLLVVFFCFFLFTANAQVDQLSTYYERSGKKETPRYKETMDYCRMLQKNSHQVHLLSFGKSGQGRDLPLLIVDREGLTDPASVHAAGKLLLLIQACIHPGEPEGKDAGLMFIRDIVIHHKYPGLLDHVSILFIPIFNVDGHERFGPFNRINQNGPVETGWRTTATNLNLNRDFLKAETPEMQAWLKMFTSWMPGFFIDTHTTDGADYQYVLTYLMEIFGEMDSGLTVWAENSFLNRWSEKLENAGFPVFPYVEFRNWHDPKSGLETGVSPPMLSQAYTSLRNRPGLLIETHMLKSYELRVSSIYSALISALEILSEDAGNLQQLERKADEAVSAPEFRKHYFPLQFETTKDSTMVRFQGIENRNEMSSITGHGYYIYGETKTTFHLPFFDKTRIVDSVKLPEAYIIPPEWKSVIDRLELHGTRIIRLQRDTTLMITGWKLTNPRWQSNSYEGRHPLHSFDAVEINELRKLPAGSVIIDMAQPGARIIAHMLEPRGNGSLLYWGFFDAIFEQKEYAENYIMEPLAAKMLADDPALRVEFEKKKATDTTFAKSPDAILNWFYNRSPYGDPFRGVYPVGRIYEREVVDGLVKRDDD